MQKDGHYCACRVWIVGVAIAIAILQQAWSQHYGKFPVVDPVLEEARLSECKPENYTSLEFLLDNGFILYKGFVSEKERQVMLNFVSSIPLPTRYLCGASDTQPHECMLWEEKMMEMWPKTLHKLYQNFRIWRKKGIMRKLKLDRWGKMRAKGSEFIAINGWPWPWSLFKGQWEFVMGTTMFGIPRAISQFKSFLTQSLNLPIHSGFHDWHTDGPSPDGGRYHKMFIMVDKDTRNGTMRGHTNLMLIPRKNFLQIPETNGRKCNDNGAIAFKAVQSCWHNTQVSWLRPISVYHRNGSWRCFIFHGRRLAQDTRYEDRPLLVDYGYSMRFPFTKTILYFT